MILVKAGKNLGFLNVKCYAQEIHEDYPVHFNDERIK